MNPIRLQVIANAIRSTPWRAADPRIVACWLVLLAVPETVTLEQFAQEAIAAAKLTVEHPEDAAALAREYGVEVV